MVSRSEGKILNDILDLVNRGSADITLIGQNIDAYEHDRGNKNGFALLLEKASGIKGLKRMHFLTSHPADFSPDILRVIKDNPVISPFFHLPPQSGSNAVLKKMRRGYTREYYLNLTEKIYEILPHAEIAGDFIVGFPGETEEDFDLTVDLLKKVRFQQAYIFKYSPREGTHAFSRLKDDIPLEVKKERNSALLAIQEKIQKEKNEQFIGKNVNVVVEGPSKKDKKRSFGRTHTNYRVVYTPLSDKPGDTVSVKITSVTPLTLYGEKTS
jgi:tRNA-2-methylthio-N6-dimethylallyladenosine synthase